MIHLVLCAFLSPVFWADVASGDGSIVPLDQGSRVDIEDYHPVDPGLWWRYRVQEGGDSYEQMVTTKLTAGSDLVELRVDSKKRQTRYVISQQEGRAFLHRVGVQLPLLRLWQTQVFDPPLPFLLSHDGASQRWTWEGQCRGPGPGLDRGEYHSRVVRDDQIDRNYPVLEIGAEWISKSEPTRNFTARYQHGVGLISVDAEGYQKRLISHGRRGP